MSPFSSSFSRILDDDYSSGGSLGVMWRVRLGCDTVSLGCGLGAVAGGGDVSVT